MERNKYYMGGVMSGVFPGLFIDAGFTLPHTASWKHPPVYRMIDRNERDLLNILDIGLSKAFYDIGSNEWSSNVGSADISELQKTGCILQYIAVPVRFLKASHPAHAAEQLLITFAQCLYDRSSSQPRLDNLHRHIMNLAPSSLQTHFGSLSARIANYVVMEKRLQPSTELSFMRKTLMERSIVVNDLLNLYDGLYILQEGAVIHRKPSKQNSISISSIMHNLNIWYAANQLTTAKSTTELLIACARYLIAVTL